MYFEQAYGTQSKIKLKTFINHRISRTRNLLRGGLTHRSETHYRVVFVLLVCVAGVLSSWLCV
jgi:hypothetical protein